MIDASDMALEKSEPTVGEMAREEFWVIAKAFFAPVYGSLLVLKQLLRTTREIDRKDDITALPAE